MKELLLIRHAKAEDHGGPLGDAARQLVDDGFDQARRVGEFLRAADLLPNLVLTSHLTRAKQTAEAVCEAAKISGPVVQHWIHQLTPDLAMSEFLAFEDFDRIALVGHEPEFSAFAEWLLGARGGSVEVKKAAVLLFRISPPSHKATLKLLLPPKLLMPGSSWVKNRL